MECINSTFLHEVYCKLFQEVPFSVHMSEDIVGFYIHFVLNLPEGDAMPLQEEGGSGGASAAVPFDGRELGLSLMLC